MNTSPRLESTVLPPKSIAPHLAGVWRQWCDHAPALSRAFLSFGFVSAAAEVLPDVRVAVISEQGQPRCFFPFHYVSAFHAAIGWAQPCAHGMSDAFGLVAAPGFSIHPQALLKAAGINYIYFDHLLDSQNQFGLTGEFSRLGHLIVLDGGPRQFWEDLRARDRSFIQDTTRRQRQLENQFGPLSLTLSSSPADLDALIAAKRRQYASTGVADPLAPPWSRRLLHVLHQSADPQCRPMLSILSAGSSWIASHFGLRLGARLHYWFPAYNPEFRRYAPGRLLLKAIIDHSVELGISVIDRGEGDSTAKRDLANAAQSFAIGVWNRSNLPSTLAAALQSASWRLRRGILRPATPSPREPRS
jgi:CelD/BcsL family acetyltransferase involved in cellulose biosynthesis